jgi:hypothetical protein
MEADRSDLHKHLEFIQNVIARLANDSFLLKGWAITVSGAFFGFGVQQNTGSLALVGLLPAMAFWALDAYYVKKERQFRKLFDSVRRDPASHEPFEMDPHPFHREVKRWGRTFLSITLLPFYGSIILVGLATALSVSGFLGDLLNCLPNK